MADFRNEQHYQEVLSKFKAQAPDLDRATKLGMAAKFAAYEAELGEQRLAAFDSSIDTSPLGPEPTAREERIIPGRIPIKVPGSSAQSPDAMFKHETAAQRGVDVSTGAPPSLRAKADLLKIKPDVAAVALEGLIEDYLTDQGVEIPAGRSAVFKDESTGKLAYLRPDENGKLRPTLINPMGVDSGDALSSIDDIAAMVAEGAAAFGGATYGGTPGASAAVGVANAGVNKLRKEAAKIMGVPEDIVDSIDNWDLFKEAALASGFEVATPVLMGLVRRARNMGRPLNSSKDAEAVLSEFRRMHKVAGEVRDSTGVNLDVSLGQSAADGDLLVLESGAGRDIVNAASLAKRSAEVQNKMATGRAMRQIHNNVKPLLAPPIDVADQAGLAQRELTRPNRAVQNLLERRERALDDVMTDAAEVARDVRGIAGIQASLGERMSVAKEYEDAAWTAFRDVIGYDPKTAKSDILISNPKGSPLREAAGRITAEQQESLSQTLASQKEGLIGDLGFNEETFKAGLNQDTLDPHHAHALLSALKDTKRRSVNADKVQWQSKDLDTMIQGLEEMITDGTYVPARGRQFRGNDGRFSDSGGNLIRAGEIPEETQQIIRGSFSAANDATLAKINLTRSNAVKNLMETSDGKFVQQPENIRRFLFTPNAPDQLNEVLGMVGDNPNVRSAIMEEFNSKYLQEVYGDGKLNVVAQRKFLQEMSGHMRVMGLGDSTDFIRNAQDMQKLVRTAQIRKDKVKAALNKSYGRALAEGDMTGRNIANEMLSGKLSLAQITNVTKQLGRADENLLNNIKASGLGVLEAKVQDASRNVASSSGINAVLQENKGRLTALYGAQYVKDLENMQEIVGVLERANLAQGPKNQLNTPALQVFRTLFGPLSTIQRRITAGTRFAKQAADNKIAAVVANPERVRALVQLPKIKPGTMRWILTAQAAGMNLDDLSPEDKELAARFQTLQEQAQRRPSSVSRGF